MVTLGQVTGEGFDVTANGGRQKRRSVGHMTNTSDGMTCAANEITCAKSTAASALPGSSEPTGSSHTSPALARTTITKGGTSTGGYMCRSVGNETCTKRTSSCGASNDHGGHTKGRFI